MALTLKDTVTWEAWVNHRAVGKSTQYNRKHLLELGARSNGARSPTEVLDQIVLEKLSSYDSALKIDFWTYFFHADRHGSGPEGRAPCI